MDSNTLYCAPQDLHKDLAGALTLSTNITRIHLQQDLPAHLSPLLLV